jgi:carbamoyltransferase
MHILGVSAFYHDSAACLIKNGQIIAAAQEERFSRLKHDASFPKQAIDYCLAEGKITAKDLKLVSFYDKPFLKFERLLETYLAFAPAGINSFLEAMPVWLKQKLWLKDLIYQELSGYKGEIIFPEHHWSHAASAFYPSPFKEAAILTVDGVGEWATTTFGVGKNNKISLLKEIHFPHSLGLLYSAFTYYTGFKVNSGEYKMMGLAPYGKPKYVQKILDHLIDIKPDGSFRLNLKYFNYCVGLTMTNRRFDHLFGMPPRSVESELTQFYMDVARSIQEVTEMVLLKMANYVYQTTKQKHLCLAGGVALNCVANGRILRESRFKDLWIQPAAGDAGGALGAALLTWYQYLGKSRRPQKPDAMKGAYLGPQFSDNSIKKLLDKRQINYIKLKRNKIPQTIAALLDQQKIVGLFQGRMEFGPRALGSRSIIGDARSGDTQRKMNLKIKFREDFRPFAPTVLEEDVFKYFDLDCPSPYMLLVAAVSPKWHLKLSPKQKQLKGLDLLNLKRSMIPAVTHVDYSARVQTISQTTNPLYHSIIKSFKKQFGESVIVNTSFNVRGEPIVCTPKDAYLCFMRTDMDYLLMGSFLIDKQNQKALSGDINWQSQFQLD